VGVIYYFPEGFEGYVKSFQGSHGTPDHPAGYALISIDNAYDKWFEIISIDTPIDLDIAKSILKRRIEQLDSDF
jgi:hypothetical protein